MATLRVGSPANERTLLLDTGSNVLWLTSDECTPESCDNKHSMPYRVEDSELGRYYQEYKVGPDGGQLTYVLEPGTKGGDAEIQYGKGRVKGKKAFDRVCFIGQSQQTKALKKFNGSASSSSSNDSNNELNIIKGVELCQDKQMIISAD